MKAEEKKRRFDSEGMILPAIKMVLNEEKPEQPVVSPEPATNAKKAVNRAVVVKLIDKLSRRE
ncbi:MAG: hypothetical protein Kow002_04080 [Anaerolineales bacterium]